MKEQVTRTGVFFRSLIDCMSSTWKETDRYYHIPKSRFQAEGVPEPGPRVSHAGLKRGLRSQHVRGFRNCIKSAWEASDSHYHIPKSRHGKAL